MTDTPPTPVGIAGLGNIGRHHADRLQHQGHPIIGGVDVSEETRERFSDMYGARTFGTLEELCKEGIEALIVTTPNKYHEQYAVAALERDIPVLVEKPLAHTVESAERIVTAANDSDAFCMTGFHRRFLNGVEALKERIDTHKLGDIHHIEANYIRRRGIPGCGSWFTQKAIAGGGALIDIGVHVLDLALHFLDFPPIKSVNATVRSEFGDRDEHINLETRGEDGGSGRYDVEDSARAFIQSANGTTISLNVAWATNQPDDTTITLVGSNGGARLNHETGELERYHTAHSSKPQPLTTTVETENNDPHQNEQQRFLEAVHVGRPPRRNTVEQGNYVQNLIDAIYTAGETGERRPSADCAIPATPAD